MVRCELTILGNRSFLAHAYSGCMSNEAFSKAMAGASKDMTWARKKKWKMLGAAALSSTAMIGTNAMAASAVAALLLFTTALAVKGGALVRWLDVVSVLTLSSLPSASSKFNLLPGKSSSVTRPETAKPAETQPPVQGVAPMELGINLELPTYYVGNRAFMNLAAADGWRFVDAQGKWQSMPTERLDANKRVVDLRPREQAVRSLAQPTRTIRGASVDIICRWQGTGTVRVDGPAVKNVKISGRSLTFAYVPKGNSSAWVQIFNIDRSDPVRGLDCRETDADPNALFDPDYIAGIKGRYSVIRFMKWAYGGVGENLPVTWAERTKPQDDVVKGRDGVTLEHMIALANATQADPWFSLPWNADDEYIRQYAKIVREKLDPNLKAYVEVSNEVWNYVYPVTGQAAREGKAAGLSTNDHQAMLHRYAERTGEVMDVWSSVFAGQMHRTVRVAAVQHGAWNARVVLGFRDTAKKVDALATAPYFASKLEADGLATPAAMDAAFDHLETRIDDRLNEAKLVKQEAAKFGLRYITYEAGQHVTGSMPLEHMDAFQKHPRMGTLYTTYLTKWRKEIGDLMVLFSDYGGASKYGAWGQRDYVGQPLSETPKENAVELFRRSYITR